MPSVDRVRLVDVAEDCLSIEGDEWVCPVHVGSRRLRLNPEPVVAVCPLYVRMMLEVSKYVESSPNACFCKVLCNRVDPAALRTANHPGETVGYCQIPALIGDCLA